MPRRCRPRAANCSSAAARRRRGVALRSSCSISPAARRCFPRADLRDGYLRADPRRSRRRAARRAEGARSHRHFDKPRYINFTEDLCAHSRSQDRRLPSLPRSLPDRRDRARRRSCRDRSEDLRRLRPVRRRLPDRRRRLRAAAADALMRKLRALLADLSRGRRRHARSCCCTTTDTARALIDALARHGDGLPANVLPLAVNEVTQVGLEAVAAAFAYGAQRVRFLLAREAAARRRGLHKTIALAEPILAGLGFGTGRVATIETDDPDALGEALRAIDRSRPRRAPATFLPVGSKRDVMRLALARIASRRARAGRHRAAAGRRAVRHGRCSTSKAARSASPASRPARPARCRTIPRRPMLRFAEDACVQCGLCKATCPEKVITLQPQIDFRAATATGARPQGGRAVRLHPLRQAVRREEHGRARRSPSSKASTGCSRIRQEAPRRHQMCEDCRVAAMAEEHFDPFGAPPRPAPRTTEDYLRERERDARASTSTSSPSAETPSAPCGPRPSRCVCSGILVPGV